MGPKSKKNVELPLSQNKVAPAFVPPPTTPISNAPLSSATSIYPSLSSSKKRKVRLPLPRNAFLKSQEYVAPLPRFLLISRPEADFRSVSPFLIAKELKRMAGGPVRSVKKISTGLLVEVTDTSQTPRLLSCTRLGDMSVNIIPHATLNSSKGVAICRDMILCSEEEIVQELANQGVTACRRLTRLENGERIPLPTHVLTFDRPVCPDYVIAGIHRVTVRPYVPPPLRCYLCQKFGHSSTKCRSEPKCHCGLPPHADSPCAVDPTCVNCGGPHTSRSRNCPQYKIEEQIQELKTRENIGFLEARRRISTSNSQHSYATAAASTPSSHRGSPPTDALITAVLERLLPALTQLVEQVVRQTPIQPRVLPATDPPDLPSLPLPVTPTHGLSKWKFPPPTTPLCSTTLSVPAAPVVQIVSPPTEEPPALFNPPPVQPSSNPELPVLRKVKNKPGWKKGVPRKSKALLKLTDSATSIGPSPVNNGSQDNTMEHSES